MSREIEDGMGFSGLAPTPDDRRWDAYFDTRNKLARAREAQLAKAVASRDAMRECLELIQGHNWHLQDDEFGREIKRRCLIALAQDKCR